MTFQEQADKLIEEYTGLRYEEDRETIESNIETLIKAGEYFSGLIEDQDICYEVMDSITKLKEVIK